MCRQHLLGEHLEMHMFMGTINQGKSLAGYINNGLVEVHLIRARHDFLVKEMKARGYNHQSPLDCGLLPRGGKISIAGNIKELKSRCKECRRLLHV
jgi:hypothetical protein